jgi:ubiquinone biosynthesis protein
LKHVNVGRLMMDSTAVAARYGLQLPAELIMFFKSIISIEGMGRVIMNDFNFLAYALEFAAELVQSRAEPAKVMRDISNVGRDLNSLLATLPRQLKQLLRRFASPEFVVKVEIREIEGLRLTTKHAANTIFLGFIISSLLVSATILHIWDVRGPTLWGQPAWSLFHYGLALLLSLIAFVNYLKK